MLVSLRCFHAKWVHLVTSNTTATSLLSALEMVTLLFVLSLPSASSSAGGNLSLDLWTLHFLRTDSIPSHTCSRCLSEPFAPREKSFCKTSFHLRIDGN